MHLYHVQRIILSPYQERWHVSILVSPLSSSAVFLVDFRFRFFLFFATFFQDTLAEDKVASRNTTLYVVFSGVQNTPRATAEVGYKICGAS